MNIGVIFAGGVGARMGSKKIPKQFLNVFDKPIIVHTLEHFEKSDYIDAIIVVCLEEWIDALRGAIERFSMSKVKEIVPGGDTGQLSIYNGLLAAKEWAKKHSEGNDIVLIHDGVRPLISAELIEANVKDVVQNGSSITTAEAKETVILVDHCGLVEEVVDRRRTLIAKAPQCFYLDDILAAHNKALASGLNDFVDSCTMMRHYGYSIHVTPGPVENIKVTTPDDFYTFRAILQQREDQQFIPMI